MRSWLECCARYIIYLYNILLYAVINNILLYTIDIYDYGFILFEIRRPLCELTNPRKIRMHIIKTYPIR